MLRWLLRRCLSEKYDVFEAFAVIFFSRFFTILYLDSCPEGCSGHGTCHSMKDLAVFFAPDYDTTVLSAGDGRGPTYANWDADMIMMCRCEYGYSGSDCSQKLCWKGDDPLTINQNDYSFQLRVSSGSPLSGILGVEFQGENSYLDLTDTSSLNCNVAFQRSVKFKEISCTVEVSTTDIRYNVTVLAWPTYPMDNNLYSHRGNPSLSEFHCDIVRAGSDTICEFLSIHTTNVKGKHLKFFYAKSSTNNAP